MGHEVSHSKLKHLRHIHHPTATHRDPPQIGPPPLGYPPSGNAVAAVPYYGAAVSGPSPSYNPAQEQQLQQALADAKRHGRNELVGEVGAAVAGAFALYELNEAKVDPEHARRHKMEAKLAGAVAVGSANYAYHEHQEKKKSEHLVEVLSGGPHAYKSNLIETKKKRDPLLALPSGHKRGDQNLLQLTGASSGQRHDSKNGKQNLLHLTSGDGGQHNKCKHHHRLW